VRRLTIDDGRPGSEAVHHGFSPRVVTDWLAWSLVDPIATLGAPTGL
jgi:hypothetical protein